MTLLIDALPIVSGVVGIVIGGFTCAMFTAGAVYDAQCRAENAETAADQFGFELSRIERDRQELAEALRVAKETNIELAASNDRMADQIEAYRAKEEKRKADNSARVSKSNRTRYARLRAAKAEQKQVQHERLLASIRSFGDA